MNDPHLSPLEDDPRIDPITHQKHFKRQGKGNNTESFEPESTMVRPEMRIHVGPKAEKYTKEIKHDDVIVCPDFFCDEDDWTIYYKLIEEMREIQSKGEEKSEWVSWHEGSHLITHNPQGSKTFQMIQERISSYFGIEMRSVGTRFNWYRDSSDWKPFHHDSAAFNPQRARNQNVTVGVSFGATRELAFLHAENKTKIYFPQTNGMLFSFGRDVNITWKHGVNALPPEHRDGKGRISIILWGKVPHVTEEAGSPPMIPGKANGLPPRNHPRDRERDRGRSRDRERERDRQRDSRPRERSRSRERRDEGWDSGAGRGGERGSGLDRGRFPSPPRDVGWDRGWNDRERDRDQRGSERDDRARGNESRRREDGGGAHRSTFVPGLDQPLSTPRGRR